MMKTAKESQFVNAMSRNQYRKAASILKESLMKAEFVDPRDDYSWGPGSDDLGYKILVSEGPEAFVTYWEDLLVFFQEELEPEWGHLHKGHLYFRLALGSFALDVNKTQEYLEDALKEDQIVAESFAKTIRISPETLLRRFPSFVTLVILERFDLDYFATTEEMTAFHRGLAPLRFDVIWDKKEVEPSLAHASIEKVVPKQGHEPVILLHDELNLVCTQRHSYSPISLVASLSEIILYHVLRYRYALIEIDGKNIQLLDRGDLLQEAVRRVIFPTEVVSSTFQLIDMMDMVIRRSSDKSYKYEMNDETPYLIGYALKILFDRALVEWAEAIEP